MFTGGTDAPAVLWILTLPIIALHTCGRKLGLFWCVVVIGILILFFYLEQVQFQFRQDLIPEDMNILWIFASIGLLLMFFAFAFISDYYDQIARLTIKKNNERSLLINKAIDESNDAIIVVNVRSKSIYQNTKFSETFGYSTVEEVNTVGVLNLFRDQETVRNIFRTTKEGKSWQGELEMISKSGRIFPVL